MAFIEKRIAGDGKISYRAMVRRKGYPTESATFERLTDAKNWAANIEVSMRERRYFKTAESKRKTMADMIERYLTELEKNNPKRLKDVRPMLEWWKDELGDYVLADITTAMIVDKIGILSNRKRILLDGEEKQITGARVNRYVVAMKHVFNIAIKEWQWLQDSPAKNIGNKPESRGRVRFLDDDERKKLLEACKNSTCPYLHLIVVLALSTGARLNEIMTLQWKNVDLERNMITLHVTKNKERRVLPLTGHAMQLMHAHGKVRLISGLVFPSPHDSTAPYAIRTAWNTAVKEAKLEDFRFHDLRHSAASYLAMSGASLAEIAEVLGHKTLQMVRRYAHLSEGHTRKVVASMNEKIFGDTHAGG